MTDTTTDDTTAQAEPLDLVPRTAVRPTWGPCASDVSTVRE